MYMLADYERNTWLSDVSPAQRTWFELYRVPKDVTGDYIIELATMDYDREKSNFVSDRDFHFMEAGIHISMKRNGFYMGCWILDRQCRWKQKWKIRCIQELTVVFLHTVYKMAACFFVSWSKILRKILRLE